MIEGIGLIKTFKRGTLAREVVHAVRDVSVRVETGETVALLGPSGCGKSTLGRLLLRLLNPDSGRIMADGHDITTLGLSAMRPYRRRMQLVSQDPDTALDPRFTLYRSIAEPLRIHQLCGRTEEKDRVREALECVGLHTEVLSRRPHEVSGGQVQRAVIARALTVSPRFLVLDEPTSMLDVSVQAQVLRLLLDLQQRFGLGYLFITHDLDLAAAFSNRVVVMEKGYVVESGDTRQVINGPAHPHTIALVRAFRLLDAEDC